MLHNLLVKRMKLFLVFLGLISSSIVSAQTKITGKVIGSDDKQPVIGATVKIKGTNTGAGTDFNGNFSLNAKPSDVLVISFIGYQTVEVSVGNSTIFNVTLKPAENSLNEVVVTGYTTQVKKEITSSVAIVDMKAAKNLITTSSEQLLQGQAAGVNVVTSGAPGGGNFISVRGISSFGSVAPLYVIDGVQTNSMSDINPNDIESLVVLKDAGSAAIYGVSGGNGVVVVTTKRGKGKSTISYDANYTNAQPLGGNPFNILSGEDQAKLTFQVDPANTFYKNGKVPDFGFQGGGAKGFGKAGDPAVDPAKYLLDPADVTGPPNDYLIQAFSKTGTDWFHEVFKPAYSQSHSLSASGANDKNSYFLSLQYLDQKGTLINTYKKRYSTRVNTIFNVKDNIRIGENIEGYFVSTPGFNNQNEGNAISMIYRIQPTIPVYDIKGNYGGTWDGTTELGNATNPVANQQRSANNGFRQWNMIGSVFGEVDLFKHLTARTSLNVTTFNFETNTISVNTYNDGEGHANASGASEASGYTSNLQWTSTLVYSQIFGKHSIKLLGGFEQSDFHGRLAQSSSNNLFSTDPAFASVSNGSSNIAGGGFQFQPSATRSLFAKLDYTYADKYILGATIRRDGFSGFVGDQRYGNFPALSVGWRVSQESFMKDVKWINDLKLRASIGTSGSKANVPNNNAYSLFGTAQPGGVAFNQSSYALNGTTLSNGFFETSIGNPATHWESDKITNAGFDATLFNNSLDLSFEMYKKSISGLLFRAPLPATAGAASSPYINIGNIQNVGFDISATYHGKVGSDFKYNAGVNFTHYKNLVVSVPGGHFDVANSRIGTIVRNQEGQEDGAFYGYKIIGYFKDASDKANSPTQTDAAPGRFKYADVDGNGKITPEDRTFLGSPNPDFTYGINLSASYKNWDISSFFYGSQGNKVANYVKYWTNFYGSFVGAKSHDLLYNSWTPTNLTPAAPIAETLGNFSTSSVFNSYYIEDGSFLKCRFVVLGYTFAPALLKQVGVDRLRLYVQGTNLFTHTKYTGLDPELTPSQSNLPGDKGSSSFGIDYGNYPNNERQYTFGVNLTF